MHQLHQIVEEGTLVTYMRIAFKIKHETHSQITYSDNLWFTFIFAFESRVSTFLNKLAKLGYGIAISKSEIINHSLTHSPTD